MGGWVVVLGVFLTATLLFGLFLCLAPLTEERSSNEKSSVVRPKVLMISIDGFRWDYLSKCPFIQSLASTHPSKKSMHASLLGEKGAMARPMRVQFPSFTFPNHFSLVTGRTPAEHGIVSNAFYDPLLKRTFKYNDPSTAILDPAWWQSQPV